MITHSGFHLPPDQCRRRPNFANATIGLDALYLLARELFSPQFVVHVMFCSSSLNYRNWIWNQPLFSRIWAETANELKMVFAPPF